MAGREKVIRDLTWLADLDSYPALIAKDALALLKEQKAVVLCKDCKHCFIEGENVRFNVCKLNHCKVQSDDWFCADGEAKT